MTSRSRLAITAFELLCASFLVLFQELALIRWLPTQVRVLAYFPNLILIAAFFGLGVGCLRAGKRNLLWLWPVSLALLIGIFSALSHVVFTQDPTNQFLWLLYFDMPQDAMVVEGIVPPIVLAFVLAALSFVALGQAVAERIQTFGEQSSSLWGYSWDILGSILGVVAFALCSFGRLFPVVWFSLVAGLGLILYRTRLKALFVYIPLMAVTLFWLGYSERYEQYSPYYAIGQASHSDTLGADAFFVTTNGAYHQAAMGLSHKDKITSDWHGTVRDGYHLPYSHYPRPIDKALVLGAGTGNDVAVLLDRGARSVDAVEIDPVILEMGKQHHPNKPYDSDRVRTINTDARTYLNQCRSQYDLIVFGTLDSLTQLSALSNVRLDNFVYTEQSMRAARRCLKPDGGLVLLFSVEKGYIEDHIMGILGRAFNQVPIVYRGKYGLFTRVYLSGKAFDHLRDPNKIDRIQRIFDDWISKVEVPTDDWPYLYLKHRGISGFYWTMLLILLGISALVVFLVSGTLRQSVLSKDKRDWEMFLFGAAFLLLETKFVTAINLLWGSTWVTSAVVFGSILLVVLLATVGTKLKPMPWAIAFGGLCISLVGTYFIPIDLLLDHHSAVKLLLSVLYVGTPVFFASACFAIRFSQRSQPQLAFGWNLLGAVAGGLLEVFSMFLGLKALTLVALCAYLGVVLLKRRSSDAQAEEAEEAADSDLEAGH